jgi:hypothetical protein
MKFERTDEYEAKLFEQALFDEKKVIKDATVRIEYDPNNWNKLKAYCEESDTFLQFPRALRSSPRDYGKVFKADVVEVIRDDGVRKYFRAMKGSIRREKSEEVVG